MVGVGAPGLVLAGKHNNGDAVHEGLVDPRHQVYRPGPDGSQAHARLTGQARERISHVGRSLLVAGHDEVEPLAAAEAVDGVRYAQGLRPRDAEDELCVFLKEALDKYIRPQQLTHD